MHKIGSGIQMDVIYSLPELDKRLRSYVPALFFEIEIIDNKKVIVKIPHQTVPKIVDYLNRHYRCGVPLEIVGV